MAIWTLLVVVFTSKTNRKDDESVTQNQAKFYINEIFLFLLIILNGLNNLMYI